MKARATVAVWMNVPNEHEQEFHEWYETEHLAEVVALDGILSGRRYYNVDGELRYLVLYEARDESVEPSAAFQGMLANPTPWTRRIRNLCDKPGERRNFHIQCDIGDQAEAGAILALHSRGGPGTASPISCLNALSGCRRYRALEDTNGQSAWLEIYDFANVAAAAAARAALPERKDARVELYRAIAEPAAPKMVAQQYRGTALVTGASSGIGAATATMLVRRGWKVICAARRADRLAERVCILGPAAVALTLDIADARSVDTLFERLPNHWKMIDVLVNCAGQDINGRQQFDTGSMAEWATTIEINTIGTMRVTHAVVPGMLQRAHGHIVNVGSTSSVNAYAGGAAYVASKFALNGFTKSILADYRGKGVRVTHIMPGLTRTEFTETRLRGDKAGADAFYASYPVTLEPNDIARAILYTIEQPPHVTIAEMVVITSE